MAPFRYAARDHSGRTHSGELEAATATVAAGELRDRGWLVLDLAPAVAARRRAPRSTRTFRLALLPATSFDVESGLRQLAMTTRSGLSLLQGLAAIAEHARRPQMTRVWRAVGDHVEAGHSLVQALERHPRRFPPVVRELVRAGEQSGSLDLAFERAADHLERRRELRATVLQAMFYPAIVLLLAGAVASYMVLAVIPVLEDFLTGMHRALPPLTRSLIGVSHWLQLHLPSLMVASGTAVLALLALDRWRPTRFVFDAALYRVPFVGRVRRLAATATFARTLATLLGNGIHIVQALDLCAGVARRPLARARIVATRTAVLDGRSLADGLDEVYPFLPLLRNLVALGEQSGELDTMLDNVAALHEAEVRTWIRRASVFIEPAITILVGAIVGVVYIAFFLAMFAIM
ncbi:MAG: type II secretion system F family protein [Planctomycetes bacterium]|nr:type II secretion system F family protein [Planctomycetota bacterium]